MPITFSTFLGGFRRKRGIEQRTRIAGQVGQNLVIDVVNPADLTLEAFNLVVNGQTKII